MHTATVYLLLLTAIPCFCQRPFYAGLSPIGYPEVSKPADLTNKFGHDLPPQLNGDIAYANMLDKLPIDQQPIWFINWRQYAEMMKNPQTYPQRPSGFNDNTSSG